MRLAALEVLQTSAMDCGPAAAACLLSSFGRPVDLGRLRESCQTGLDGTSIDVIEQVLQDHGLRAEQQMLPADRIGDSLPALAVVRLPDGAPHFIVIWRRIGPFVQVMDPARGARWQRLSSLLPHLMRHSLAVSALDWQDWARSPENLDPLRKLARHLHLAEDVIPITAAEPGWFPLAAMEACLRLTRALDQPPGRRAQLFHALMQETRAAEQDVFRLVPPPFWPVVPDPTLRRGEDPRLLLQGAVLIRVLPPAVPTAPLPEPDSPTPPTRPISPWTLILTQARGRLAALSLVTTLVVLGSLCEAAAFRGLVQPCASSLSLPGLLALMGGLYLLRLTLGAQTLGLGRRIESALRQQSLRQILRLPDRWHASRPLGDLAERAFSLHQIRTMPGILLHLAQALAELVTLSAGVIWLQPGQAALTLSLTAVALALPFLTSPLLRDRDLALRSLGAAQAGVLLDAMRGRAALRAHSGANALLARNEALLRSWMDAARGQSWRALMLMGLGQAIVLALIGTLILGPSQSDLLFLWWAMKLPAAAADLAGVIRQLPAQEAILARLNEPLAAPIPAGLDLPPDLAAAPGLGIRLTGARALASGHAVLHDIDLTIAPGEALAIVGPSGSGKSSLINVLMGRHTLSEGEILIQDHALAPGMQAALRQRIVWLDPTDRIWRGSLQDNIGSQAERHLAAVRLDLSPHTQAGSGGALLSAGEGQRLRLARALSHSDPALILCDEALRGLDRPLRRHLLALARQHWAGRTLIWVTHDLQEAMTFPRVIVMDQGQIQQDGPPARLAAEDGTLARMIARQTALDDRLDQVWHRIKVERFHVQPSA